MNKKTKAALKTLLKTFGATALAQYIALGQNIFEIDAEGWKGIASSGIAAVVTLAYGLLDKSDNRFGIGSSEEA